MDDATLAPAAPSEYIAPNNAALQPEQPAAAPAESVPLPHPCLGPTLSQSLQITNRSDCK